MTEKRVEARLVQGVRDLGGRAYKFVSPGNAGVPDRLVVLPGGQILFAEIKAEGGRLSAVQLACIEELRRLGCEVWTVWGVHGVEDFLALCRERVKEAEAG